MDLAVAAKVFHKDTGLSADEEEQMAEHEYATVGNLTHENIVRVHGLMVRPQPP